MFSIKIDIKFLKNEKNAQLLKIFIALKNM